MTTENLQKILLEKYNSLDEAIQDAEYTSQLEALLQLIMGHNVFVSGPAGSGKSYVIEKYFSILKEYNPNVKIYKTSTTALSAINIEGITIQSYSGKGFNKMPFEEYMKIHKIKDDMLYKSSKTKIKETNVLIVDEVSMLSEADLNFLIKRILDIRKTVENIQFIFSGDFSQLPPVASREDINAYGEELGNFSYKTEAWDLLNLKVCYLDKIHRAKDIKLQRLLHLISLGDGMTPESYNLINSLQKVNSEIEKGVALLLPKNAEVDKINREQQIKNKGKLYKSTLEYDKNNLSLSKEFAKQQNAPLELMFKNNDTVMITSNLPLDSYICLTSLNGPQLKNGMIGVFKTFFDEFSGEDRFGFVYEYKGKKYEYILEKLKFSKEELQFNFDYNIYEKETITYYKQYPMKLAYAISIHKSQGQTFDHVIADLTQCWAEGLGYVALSRATSFDDLKLFERNGSTYNKKALLVNNKSLEIKKDTLEEAKKLRTKYKEIYKYIFNNLEYVIQNQNSANLKKSIDEFLSNNTLFGVFANFKKEEIEESMTEENFKFFIESN